MTAARRRTRPLFLRGIAATLLAAIAVPGLAHEDTPLQRDRDGRLRGLPARYEPATLTIGYAADGRRKRIASLRLAVHGQRIALPRCLLRDIRARETQEVLALASWYHDTTRSPAYLHVRISGPYTGPTEWREGSESIFLSLETGRLLRYTRREKALYLSRFWEGVGMREMVVDVRALCDGDTLNRLLDPAYTLR